MSILLSAYFPEGIVFTADKNITLVGDIWQDVEVGAATKVIPWAHHRAVAGYCGLGQLAGLSMEEWMRQFAAKTRDFYDLDQVAHQLQNEIQRDFNRDYPEGTNVDDSALIIHLGGFRYESDVAVPAIYIIANVEMTKDGLGYQEARRDFYSREGLRKRIGNEGPNGYRRALEKLYQAGQLAWFNNGLRFPAFNVLKEDLWRSLIKLRKYALADLPQMWSLDDRVAYCRMAVELYGSFYRYHYLPSDRSVGGGSDAVSIPWPKP